MNIRRKIIYYGLRYKTKIKKIPLLNRFAKSIYHKMISSKNLDYSSMSINEIKKLMDERFNKNEAYNLVCLWDKVRADEITKQVMELISPADDKKILELGCGLGGSALYISQCKEFVGTDLSEVATSIASQAFGKKPNFKFIPMDAMDLKFEDNSFDVVLAKEVIEHLSDARKTISESFRVLKPGGVLLITSPNRDSLHLRVNRMLGYSDFKCCNDHIKELTFRETVEILINEGFVLKDTRGVFLLPYWGIRGIDEHIRHLTDNDPHMIEMLRDLGERAGPEYAFEFVILASKPGPDE